MFGTAPYGAVFPLGNTMFANEQDNKRDDIKDVISFNWQKRRLKFNNKGSVFLIFEHLVYCYIHLTPLRNNVRFVGLMCFIPYLGVLWWYIEKEKKFKYRYLCC